MEAKRRIGVLFLALLCVVCMALPGLAKTRVVMWIGSQPAGVLPWLEEFEQDFNATHDEIELVVEVYPTVSEMRTKLVVALAGGVAPDIMYESSNVMSEWIANEIALPLDEYIAQSPDIADILPDAIAPLQYKGKTWALPFTLWPVFDLYNLDIYAQSGISLPDTWDELITATRKITKYEADNRVSLSGYRGVAAPVWTFVDVHMAMEQLGQPSIVAGDTQGRLNTTAAQQALTYIKELWQAGGEYISGTRLQDVLNGRAAVQHLGSGINMVSLHGAVEELGINLALRRFVGPTKNTDVVQHNAGTFFVIASTKNPDEAWEALHYFLQPKNLKGYILAHTGVQSVRRSQMNDRDLLALPFARESIALLTPPITTSGPTHAIYSQFRQPVGQILLDAAKGLTPINSSLAEAERLMNQIIAEKMK